MNMYFVKLMFDRNSCDELNFALMFLQNKTIFTVQPTESNTA